MKNKSEGIGIDNILSSQTKANKLIELDSKNYCFANSGDNKHIFSVPGFSSAFDIQTSVYNLIADMDNSNSDTAFLQFIDFQKIYEFTKIYNKNSIYTKIIKRNFYLLDIYQKNISNVIDKFKKGTKQKANSSTDKYQLINSFEMVADEFYALYKNLAKIKQFSNVYLYTKDNFIELSRFNNIFFIGIKQDNKLIAGSFFRIIHNHIKRIDYLLSASMIGISSKWIVKIITNGINLGIEKNCNIFNFGGSISDDDSLSDFKLSFGSIKTNFYNCRLINRKSDKLNFLMEKNILNSSFFP